MRLIGVLIFAIVLGFISSVRAQTTGTPPGAATQAGGADGRSVQNGKLMVSFAVWQGNAEVTADKDGVVHLKHGPFEMQFAGDVGETAILATHAGEMIKALVNAKGPVITLIGMGAAHDAGVLLLRDGPEDGPKVQPWEKFAENFSKEEGAKYAATLQAKLKELPLVLDGGLEYLDAEKMDSKNTLKVATLFKGDLAKEGGFDVAVILTDTVDGAFARSVKARSFKIAFDR